MTRPSVILSKRARSSRTAALHLSSLPMSRAGAVNGIEANFTLNEAERLDPRNPNLLTQSVFSYIHCRRFQEAERKLDQILDITPDDLDTIVTKAAIAQVEGDLPRAAKLLAPLHPKPSSTFALEKMAYQAILERNPAPVISQLRAILAKPDPALGYANGELRFWLGWAEDIGGDHAAAQESWRQARGELEPLLKEQPENHFLIGDLALITMSLGDKAAASAFAERDMAVNPVEKDAIAGPRSLEIVARVAAQAGEPDRAIATLAETAFHAAQRPPRSQYAVHSRIAPARSDVRSAAK